MEDYRSYQKVINLSILPKTKGKKQDKVTKPIKRRTKTGCFTCRKRKKKCDEIIENGKCKNCTRNFLCCSWPQDKQISVENPPIMGNINQPTISTDVFKLEPVVKVEPISPRSPNLYSCDFNSKLIASRMIESNERERKLSVCSESSDSSEASDSSETSVNEPLTPKSPNLYDTYHDTEHVKPPLPNEKDMQAKFINISVHDDKLCAL